MSAGGASKSRPRSSAERKWGSERPLPRIPQRLGRIRLGPAFALAEAEEAAQRGQMPGDARLGVARLVQGRHVAAEIEDRHVARRGKPAAVGFGSDSRPAH